MLDQNKQSSLLIVPLVLSIVLLFFGYFRLDEELNWSRLKVDFNTFASPGSFRDGVEFTDQLLE